MHLNALCDRGFESACMCAYGHLIQPNSIKPVSDVHLDAVFTLYESVVRTFGVGHFQLVFGNYGYGH